MPYHDPESTHIQLDEVFHSHNVNNFCRSIISHLAFAGLLCTWLAQGFTPFTHKVCSYSRSESAKCMSKIKSWVNLTRPLRFFVIHLLFLTHPVHDSFNQPLSISFTPSRVKRYSTFYSTIFTRQLFTPNGAITCIRVSWAAPYRVKNGCGRRHTRWAVSRPLNTFRGLCRPPEFWTCSKLLAGE